MNRKHKIFTTRKLHVKGCMGSHTKHPLDAHFTSVVWASFKPHVQRGGLVMSQYGAASSASLQLGPSLFTMSVRERETAGDTQGQPTQREHLPEAETKPQLNVPSTTQFVPQKAYWLDRWMGGWKNEERKKQERGGEKACSLTPTENVRHIFNIISLNRGGHRTKCV